MGVLLVWAALGHAFSDPPVEFVVTLPGTAGTGAAFVAEAAMAGGLMLMVVAALASVRLMPLIGLFAGLLVAVYIALLAPLSGMSINPARSFASALADARWESIWLYFSAPVLGMLVAVEGFHLTEIGKRRFCAKLNHDEAYRCIHCGHQPAAGNQEKRSDQ
jgi:aquaporin Z